MKRTLILMFSLFVLEASKAETMILGPYVITNTSSTSYPQFPPSAGYLHSVSFEISNFNVSYDLILDNDETVSLPYDVDNSLSFNVNNIPFAGFPFYGRVFSATTNLVGTISGVDDGDGIRSHNGGVDEEHFSISHSNLYGQVSSSLSSHLAYNTGLSQRGLSLLVGRMFGPIPIGTELESYVENQTYGGTLYVHYTYNDQPVIPKFQAITLSSNSLVELNIENLSVGSSNTIQRCSDLRSNDWVNVDTFISSSYWFRGYVLYEKE
jgi:hypothetical protein